MADMWYYTSEGRQMEPVSTGQLQQLAKNGALKPTDMVWKEGMAKWVRASATRGLFPEETLAAARRPAAPARAEPTRAEPTRAEPTRAEPTRAEPTRAEPTRAEPTRGKRLDDYPDDEPAPRERTRPSRERRGVRDYLDDLDTGRRPERHGDDPDRSDGDRSDGDRDDPDQDERPRRRRRRSSGMGTGAMVGLFVGGGVLLAAVVVVIVILIANSGGGDNLANGPITYNVSLNANRNHTRNVTLTGGVTYEFVAKSDRNSDVDILLKDSANDQIVAGDESIGPNVYFTFRPAETRAYRVETRNLGPGSNQSTVTIRELGGQAKKDGKQPPKDADKVGFDKVGFDKIGFDKKGLDKIGLDKIGFDKIGFDKKNPPVGGGIPITPGQLVNGQLNANDPRDRVENQPCKIYQVTLKAGFTYRIDMESKAFDTFLRLEDANGQELAFDDDSGANLNARIVFQPFATGTYRIIATRFRHDDRTGPYALRVTESK